MKACFQIVERRKSIKRFYFQYQTEAICIHETQCRIRIYLIHVVLVHEAPCEHPNANKHPCDRCDPCAKKNIRVIRIIRVQKNLVFKPPVSALSRTKIRAIRVRIKRQRKIRVKRYSFYSDYYFPSVSGPTANLVFKRPSNQNIIPVKTTIKKSEQ